MQTTTTTTAAHAHLWDAEHSYYCSEGNYFSNDCRQEFETFAEFLAAEDDADLDYNLVFRWDWKIETPSSDDYYRDGQLNVFFVGQRKGIFRSVGVRVCRADEPAVREYLQPRLRHLLQLWAPLTAPLEGDD